MLKKIVFLLIIMALSYQLNAQEVNPVDYKKIEKNISKKKSNLNYQSLLQRFHEVDTLLTLEEKRHLYYGYIFQPGYNPYASHVNTEIINQLLQKDSLNRQDYSTIIVLSDEMLDKNPFDMDALFNLYYVYGALQDGSNFNKISFQLGFIIDAILSTGNGAEKESAMYVIRVSDEYSMIDVLGFESKGNQSMIDYRYDYIEIRENAYGLEGLYFEISASLNHLEKTLGK